MARCFHVIMLGLLGAVIVHICILMLVPHYARYNTWSRLQKGAGPYVLQRPDPDNLIASTSDPFLRLGSCSFNLSDGPVHITARGQVPFWSLSVYNYAGINVYSLNSRTAPNGILDMIVSDPVQMIDFKQTMSDTYAHSVLTAQNMEKGFLVVRVLAPSVDRERQVEAFLASASCKQVSY